MAAGSKLVGMRKEISKVMFWLKLKLLRHVWGCDLSPHRSWLPLRLKSICIVISSWDVTLIQEASIPIWSSSIPSIQIPKLHCWEPNGLNTNLGTNLLSAEPSNVKPGKDHSSRVSTGFKSPVAWKIREGSSTFTRLPDSETAVICSIQSIFGVVLQLNK